MFLLKIQTTYQGRSKMRKLLFILTLCLSPAVFSQQSFVLIGWNELGMHCANKNFNNMAILPPLANNLPSGVYLCRLQLAHELATKRLAILR
jgi:hypothetical protein